MLRYKVTQALLRLVFRNYGVRIRPILSVSYSLLGIILYHCDFQKGLAGDQRSTRRVSQITHYICVSKAQPWGYSVKLLSVYTNMGQGIFL